MSGFGIHEQHAAGVELWAEGKRWRETSFLHQMSTGNGSLMLAENHDELWRECLERTLGQPAGTTWERMTVLLRTMPAQKARKKMWNASYLWWLNMEGVRLRMLTRSVKDGSYVQAEANPLISEMGRMLVLTSEQLVQLSELLEKVDNDTIEVVDEKNGN